MSDCANEPTAALHDLRRGGLAGVHPQTLRIYEQRRLIAPQRTPKGTRLYCRTTSRRCAASRS